MRIGDFDSDVVCRKFGIGVWSDIETEHDLGSDFNGVDSSHFGNERERPRRSKITFDDFDLVVLGDELNIVWPSDVERVTNLLRGNLRSFGSFRGRDPAGEG